MARAAEEPLLLFTFLLQEAPPINIHASYLNFSFFETLPAEAIPPLRKSDNADNVYLSPDPSILLLEPAARRERLFAIMMDGLARLIAARGWDAEPFARLERQCRERDLKLHYYGPPKFNRAKRHQARGHFWFSDDGVAMASIQILDSSRELLVESEGLRTHYTKEGLARAGKTLRWDDATTVSMRAFADRFNIYPARVRIALDPLTQSWTSSSDESDFGQDEGPGAGGWGDSGPELAGLPAPPRSDALLLPDLGMEPPKTSTDVVPVRSDAAGDRPTGSAPPGAAAVARRSGSARLRGMTELAVVTGATSGIGRAFAESLAAQGHDLVVVGRRADRLAAFAAAHPDVQVQTLAVDLATPEGIAAVASVCAEQPVTILINNAGVAHYMPLAELSAELADELVQVKFAAPVALTRAALPGMLERGTGTIVTVAGMIAFSGPAPASVMPRRAVYGAALAGQVAFSQLLAAELTGSPIRVQVLCPGVVATEFHTVQGLDLSAVPRMSPEDVVTACWRGLELGEVVTAPGVEDATLLDAVSAADLAAFAGQSPQLATRYR